MKKLFRLEISSTAIVMAESEDDAKTQASKILTSDRNMDISAYQITSMQDIPLNIDKMSNPWGSDKSICDLLAINK
jgi:hypothetical protein